MIRCPRGARSLAALVSAMLAAAALAASARAAEDGPAEKPAAPAKLRWAHIALKGAYPEGAQAPGLFGDLTESLADGIERLDKAAQDGNVHGVVLHIQGPEIGWGKLYELRQAIGRLRKDGKKIYAWLDSGTTKDYLLATACDEVVMPESGVLVMVGLRAEVTFFKNLFDKLDVKAEMLRVGEYKSAAEPFTRTEMSPEFRKEMEEILDDYWRQMVDEIAEARQLDREQVVAAIDSGPHSAKAARELGLIDRIAYEDELEQLIRGDEEEAQVEIVKGYGKKKIDTDFSGLTGMVKLMNLMMGVETATRKTAKPKIAVIHATGPIMTGESQVDLFGEQTLGANTIVKAVKTAREDASVKAIVLRVDSPGGSALASDLMWRALEKVDKPIVVSMGDVAASGGYYISMGADAIFAEPGTLTGSIGVVGGKVALKGLFEKVGITTSVVSRGKHSGAMSTLEGFSESERKAMQKLLDEIYEQFTQKAAAGRKMEVEELEKLARGRVYTGAMAQKIGLVDKLGSLDDAVAHAKKLAKLDEGEQVERLVLPKATSPFEALFGPIDSEEARVRSAAPQSSGLLRELGELSPELARQLRAAGLVGLLAREPRLTLMPFRIDVR
ncbi:MAG: signal peptide peptidase SppA [Planctomycetales bacterium]